jgi:hypothetical protein
MTRSNDFTRALDAASVAATCLQNAIAHARATGEALDPIAIIAMAEASNHAQTLAFRLRDATDLQREALEIRNAEAPHG